MPDWDLFWKERTTRDKLLNRVGIFYNRVFAKHIAHYIGPPRSCGPILEVGTGRGICSLILNKMGYNCISVDNSEFAIKLARGQGLDVVFANGYHLPFSSVTFEVAFTQGLLEHLTVKEQVTILEEMHRVAHKSIHSVPAKYGVMDWGERIFTGLGKKWPYPDEKKYNKSEFIGLLLTTFRSVRVMGFLGVDWIGYCK